MFFVCEELMEESSHQTGGVDTTELSVSLVLPVSVSRGPIASASGVYSTGATLCQLPPFTSSSFSVLQINE